MKTSKRKPPREHVDNTTILAEAIAEIVANPETPDELFNKVADFLLEATSGDFRAFWNSPNVVAHALSFHRKKVKAEAR